MQPTTSLPKTEKARAKEKTTTACYHCGTHCISNHIHIDEKIFCCEGCKTVFEILDNNNLCNYYELENHPGLTQIKPIRKDKYNYLDNEDIAKQLYQFTDGNHIIATFYLPNVHCSSCMWLIEHLNRIHPGITESRLNFTSKEVTIHFKKAEISIRSVVELLAMVGYEPYISLQDKDQHKTKKYNKHKIYKLGVAGFCFGNIMMMSFPEYFSLTNGIEEQYAQLFRYFNLILSIPVFFYSGSEFFVTAWKGIQQKILNIDAPIALAVIITFARSIYEILTNTGAGYLDSMSGIVFFMLVGRVVQERTYQSISFHRDYKSYFPIAVNVQTPEGIVSKPLQDLKEQDIVVLHNEEIIPTDALLMSGKAMVDYSFVTGESEPIQVNIGEMVYAGGRQIGEQIVIEVRKPVAASYLTSLWNHQAFAKNKAVTNDQESYIHTLSKYFTIILFSLAALTATYWAVYDPSKIITSISAMLIVACPCALLLTVTFTNGHMLRLLSNNGLFLRDATVLEPLGQINHIVFDKTGTLTEQSHQVTCNGHQLSEEEQQWVAAVVKSSKHPLSKSIQKWLGATTSVPIQDWQEVVGKGIKATVQGHEIMVGSATFIGIEGAQNAAQQGSVYIKIDNNITSVLFASQFRGSIPAVIDALKPQYKMSLLSGDNNQQQNAMEQLLGVESKLLFKQSPSQKLQYIQHLQNLDNKVLMMGDGLNDAGALQQSNVGITLADDINNFTPSCDAILNADQLSRLPGMLQLSQKARVVIAVSFVVSILYNIVGLYFAMQGLMKPMVAAILMPCSTLSIVLITGGLSSFFAKKFKLSL